MVSSAFRFSLAAIRLEVAMTKTRNFTLIKNGQENTIKPEHMEPGKIIAHLDDREQRFTRTMYFYGGKVTIRTVDRSAQSIQKTFDAISCSLANYSGVCTGYAKNEVLQQALTEARWGAK